MYSNTVKLRCATLDHLDDVRLVTALIRGVESVGAECLRKHAVNDEFYGVSRAYILKQDDHIMIIQQ